MLTFALSNQQNKKMKKHILIAMLLMCGLAAQADDVMKKEKDGTYVVNTTTLAQDVEGYNGPTPVEVYIKKNKIVKVVLLKSQETPKYNARIKKQMLPAYEGQKVSKNKYAEVDALTGATFTSDAVKENVKRGLEYYWKHK
jgi:electron transport complex protein RnfG